MLVVVGGEGRLSMKAPPEPSRTLKGWPLKPGCTNEIKKDTGVQIQSSREYYICRYEASTEAMPTTWFTLNKKINEVLPDSWLRAVENAVHFHDRILTPLPPPPSTYYLSCPHGLCALFLNTPQLYFYFQNADIHHSRQHIKSSGSAVLVQVVGLLTLMPSCSYQFGDLCFKGVRWTAPVITRQPYRFKPARYVLTSRFHAC